MRQAVIVDIPTRTMMITDAPAPTVVEDDDAIIAVDAVGICGTDVHIMAGLSYVPATPFVLGHEFAGEVVDVGPLAGSWRGRRVVATPFEGCGHCALCLAGQERLCPDLRSIIGVKGRPGALAERVRVRARQLIEVPSGLTSQHAACVVDSGATAVNAVGVATGARPADVAVIGFGPLGVIAAELLRVAGIEALVVEPNPGRRALAEQRGFECPPSTADIGQIDCVIECSGSGTVPTLALDVLRARGLLVLAGYAEVPAFDFAPVARKELTIRGVRSGSRADLERALWMAADGSIQLPPIEAWPLEQIDDALESLLAGRVAGKVIIDIR